MSRLRDWYGRLLWHGTGHRGVTWRLPTGEACRIDPRCRWIRHPTYEAAVVDYLRNRVRSGACCIDVGAHVGFYVLQMALWSAPSGHVIAFEPNPYARRLLENNVRLNALADRVGVASVAVTDTAGDESFFGVGDASGLSRLGGVNPQHTRRSAMRVATISLDEFCEREHLQPDCILVDVEGAELQVLRGARRLLAAPRSLVVVEIHPSLWNKATVPDAIRDLVRRAGRRIVGLTGQADPLAEYGTVALTPDVA